jgi:hypothetical protein
MFWAGFTTAWVEYPAHNERGGSPPSLADPNHALRTKHVSVGCKQAT